MTAAAFDTARTEAPEQVVLGLISGFWLSRAVYAAAKLGIADLLEEEPRTAADLAFDAGADAASIYRLLRALAAGGFFEEREGARFAHNERSRMLRSDAPSTIRWTAISELGDDHYGAWEGIADTVRTGATAFPLRYGMPVWRYYNEHPADGEVFEKSMTAITGRVHDAILDAYDFSGARCVMDIGGGEGALLLGVLDRNPGAAGILFDQPQVVEMARERNPEGARRMRLAPGDFFDSLPGGADLHMLKWIIHDWDDGEAIAILRNCRSALAPGGKLLLIELPVPGANQGLFPKLMDLNMMIMTGGRERTEAQYRELLDQSGFRLTRVIPAGIVCLIEAEPK